MSQLKKILAVLGCFRVKQQKGKNQDFVMQKC